MAIQITDGFDMYNGSVANTGLQAKWFAASDTTVTLAAGRFGGQCFQVTAATNTRRMWGRSFPAAVTAMAFGFALRTNTLPTLAQAIVYIRGATNTVFQDGLKLNTDGSLTAGRITDTFGTFAALQTTAGGVIAANTWHYVEVELVIHDTTGSFKVWVDGTQVINQTGVDTRSNVGVNPADADTIWLGIDGSNPAGSNVCSFDDFYYRDTNTHLGPCKIETLRPDADTATKDFTPNSGTANFSRVNETLVDGDTSYVQASVVGNRDLYTLGDLSSAPASIYALNVCQFAEKTDAAARTIYNSVQSNATDSDGSAFTLAASYGRFDRILETDPSGGGAWTAARVNALMVGPKVAS